MRPLALFAVIACAGVTVVADDKKEPAKDDRKKAEVEWAKDVAVDFLKAIKSQQGSKANRLFTPDLAKQYENQSVDVSPPLNVGRFSAWEFDPEKVSPDKAEVVVRGRLTGKYEKTEFTSAFTIRVVKTTEPGLWRIDYFLFEKCQEVPVKK